MYVLRKWGSKMCILMVILRVITINYSHRAIIIIFLIFFLWWIIGGGDDCTGHPPTWNIGGNISPHPPGIDTHACGRSQISYWGFPLVWSQYFFIIPSILSFLSLSVSLFLPHTPGDSASCHATWSRHSSSVLCTFKLKCLEFVKEI